MKARTRQEEIEQEIIERSVQVKFDEKKVWVDLPFLKDPDLSLSQRHNAQDNYDQALKVFKQQACKPLENRHIVQPSPVPDDLNLTDMNQVPVGSQVGRVQDRQVVHPLPTPDNPGRSISVCADGNSVLSNKDEIIFMLMTIGFILMTQIVDTSIVELIHMLSPWMFICRFQFYWFGHSSMEGLSCLLLTYQFQLLTSSLGLSYRLTPSSGNWGNAGASWPYWVQVSVYYFRTWSMIGHTVCVALSQLLRSMDDDFVRPLGRAEYCARCCTWTTYLNTSIVLLPRSSCLDDLVTWALPL